MAGRLMEFAGWLANQVFDVVGAVAGEQDVDGGSTVDLQVGKTVFHDVPAQMRTELWLSQLHRKGPDGSAAPGAGEYYDLLFEKLSPDVLSEIDKDTHRTFPGHVWLSSPEGQKAMLNVLRAYAISDPEIGYTQGMNFLAGLLLTYLPSEPEAYAALSLLMRARGLREIYLPDMSVLQIRLWQLSRLLPPRLAAHLEAHAALPVLYAASWLLTCFAADFPAHFAARVVDVLITGQAAASPLLKVALGIVSHCEARLMRMTDFEEMVNFLRHEVPQWSKATLQDLLTDALSKPWTARQLRILDQINGAETVLEAVTRVNKLARQTTTEAAEVPSVTASPASTSPQASPTQPAQAGSADHREQGQQDLPTPRTVARTLSITLPPRPSRGPSGSALPSAWSSWKSAPDLERVEPRRVRIESAICDVDPAQLDPQLSRALSAYSPMDPRSSGASSTGPAARSAAATSALPSPQQHAQRSLPSISEHGQPERRSPSQQQQQQQQAEHQVGGPPEHAFARWQAFAKETSLHLAGAPSPFDAAPSPSSTTSTAERLPPLSPQQPSAGQAAPPGGASAKPAAAAGGQQTPAAPSAGADSSAPALGSYGMQTLTSAAPLVDLSERRGQPATAAPASDESRAGGALQSFLGLFSGGTKSSGSEQGAGNDSSGNNLVQDAPSSHGSSLAAVLHALSLNANWASTLYGTASSGGNSALGPAGGGMVSPGDRRLRHSSEGEEWSSFKTAAGSDGGSEAGSSNLGNSSVPSWQSVGTYGRQASGVRSDGSSAVPSHDAPGPSQAGTAQRLSSEAATQRATSLQEQHLRDFLDSPSGGDAQHKQ